GGEGRGEGGGRAAGVRDRRLAGSVARALAGPGLSLTSQQRGMVGLLAVEELSRRAPHPVAPEQAPLTRPRVLRRIDRIARPGRDRPELRVDGDQPARKPPVGAGREQRDQLVANLSRQAVEAYDPQFAELRLGGRLQ